MTWWEFISFWGRIGWTNFGGPAGQIAQLHLEVVDRRGWIKETRFLHAVNFCMALPGPEALQLAIYSGWLLKGIRGGVIAGILFLLPSFLILCVLGWVYHSFGDLILIRAFFEGIRPIVLALVFLAAFRLGRKTLKTPFLAVIALTALLCLAVFKINYPWIILFAVSAGFLHDRFVRGRQHIDEPVVDTEFKLSSGKPITILIVCLLLWLLPLVMGRLSLGPDNTLELLAVFFTKSAFVGFGGAYALIPYVSEAIVTSKGWLTPGEVMDSLALGETTPGPLLMIFTFMGYLVGDKAIDLALLPAPLPGILGAAAVTWYTFLPSFLLVLAGAPLSERLRERGASRGILATLSAAVVGVIASLALYLGEALLAQAATALLPIGLMIASTFVALGVFLKGRMGAVPMILLGGGSGVLWVQIH